MIFLLQILQVITILSGVEGGTRERGTCRLTMLRLFFSWKVFFSQCFLSYTCCRMQCVIILAFTSVLCEQKTLKGQYGQWMKQSSKNEGHKRSVGTSTMFELLSLASFNIEALAARWCSRSIQTVSPRPSRGEATREHFITTICMPSSPLCPCLLGVCSASHARSLKVAMHINPHNPFAQAYGILFSFCFVLFCSVFSFPLYLMSVLFPRSRAPLFPNHLVCRWSYPRVLFAPTSPCISVLSEQRMSLGPFGLLMMKSLNVAVIFNEAVLENSAPMKTLASLLHSKSFYLLCVCMCVCVR